LYRARNSTNSFTATDNGAVSNENQPLSTVDRHTTSVRRKRHERVDP